MAAAAVANYPIQVTPTHITIGNQTIPFGRINTFHVYRTNRYEPAKVHQVRVWADGAMGLPREQSALLDFALQTREKTDEFVQAILQNAKAGFSTSFKAIRPDLVDAGSGKMQGRIHVDFYDADPETAEVFAHAIAPAFFPKYAISCEDSSVLLTSLEGEEKEITREMNEAIVALNRQNFGHAGELVAKNRDPRFPGVRRSNQPDGACVAVAGFSRSERYTVSPDCVMKDTFHYGAPPAGHFRTAADTDHSYYAPEPLPIPGEEAYKRVREAGEYAQALAGVIEGPLAGQLQDLGQKVKEKLQSEEVRTPVGFECLTNQLKTDFAVVSEIERTYPEQMKIVEDQFRNRQVS